MYSCTYPSHAYTFLNLPTHVQNTHKYPHLYLHKCTHPCTNVPMHTQIHRITMHTNTHLLNIHYLPYCTLFGINGSCVGLRFIVHLMNPSFLALGVSLAFALRPYQLSYRQIKYFSFPGELLMRMLQMLVLPLIVSSLVTGESPSRCASSGSIRSPNLRKEPGLP